MRLAIILILLAVTFSACTAPDVLAPVPPQAPEGGNLAGQAYLMYDQETADALETFGYAPPWDVWQSSNPLVIVPQQQEFEDGPDALVLIDHSTNDAKLTYNRAYITSPESEGWTQLAVQGQASPYPNFLSGDAELTVPASLLSPGENLLLTFVCTNIVPVNTSDGLRGQYACGCSEANIDSCGKWNAQTIEVFKRIVPVVCGNGVCEAGEDFQTCAQDCLDAPDTPESPDTTETDDEEFIVELRLTYNDAFVTFDLPEGETRIQNIDGRDFEVTNLIVGDVNGELRAKLLINGEVTNSLAVGDTDGDFNEATVTITDIFGAMSEETSLVEFMLGSEVVRIHSQGEVEINRENIEDAQAQIMFDTDGSRLRINQITYELSPDVDYSEFVYGDNTLVTRLDEPQGLLGMDLGYFPPYSSSLPPEILQFEEINDELFMRATTRDEQTLYLQVAHWDGQEWLPGDETSSLYTSEGLYISPTTGDVSSSSFPISLDDYFIVSSGERTIAVVFADIDTDEQVLVFEDLVDGSTYESSYSTILAPTKESLAMPPSADLTRAGVNHGIWVVNTSEGIQLAIDMDGDGLLAGASDPSTETISSSQAVPMYLSGGAMITIPGLNGVNPINVWFSSQNAEENLELEIGMPATSGELVSVYNNGDSVFTQAYNEGMEAMLYYTGYGIYLESTASKIAVYQPGQQINENVYVALGDHSVSTGPIPVMNGNAAFVGWTANPLRPGQEIESFGRLFDASDMETLASGRVTTALGSTEYTQEILLLGGETKTGVFNDDEGAGFALRLDQLSPLLRYTLNFDEGFVSDVEAGLAIDYENEVLHFMGKYYTVVSGVLAGPEDLTLELISGDIADTLEEGTTRTYTINGQEYEVTVLVVGDGAASFLVNGQATDTLSAGESDTLADGTELFVREVISTTPYR